jgi:thiol-disulfide isomerase/thioredoxin
LPYLTAAVVLVGILGMVNLLLLIALARRIREPGGMATGNIPAGHRQTPYKLLPGSKPAPFQAETINGEVVTLSRLVGDRALVGFFAPGCGPCHEQLPDFIELARSIPGGPSQVIAVVSAPAGAAATEFASQLDGVASVVLEQSERGVLGPVAHAFASYGWPSFYLLGVGGVVESTNYSVSVLIASLAAAR